MIKENKQYIDLAKQFIDEHNDNKNWSPLDRLETMAIVMFAKWLDSKKNSKIEN